MMLMLRPGARPGARDGDSPDPRHDPRPRIEYCVNKLKEFAVDRHQLLLVQSARTRTPSLKAAFDLRAAQWSTHADELHELVVELRGTPEELSLIHI